jgi:LysM repeat protein
MKVRPLALHVLILLVASPAPFAFAQEVEEDVAPIEMMEESGFEEETPSPIVEEVPPAPDIVKEPVPQVAPANPIKAAEPPVAAVSAVDEPDLKRELRFHQIYKMYNESPLPSEVWGEALGKTEAQTYTVQKGDTLWGLSETLFGDANYWPKIWSINNNEIENPHEILPEQIVEFYPGSLEEPPSMAVDESPSDPAVGVEETVSEQTPVVEAQPETKPEPTLEEFQSQLLRMATLPEPSVKSRAAGAIPPSLPSWELSRTDPKKAEVMFEVTPVNRDFGQPESPLTYFISEGGAESSNAVGSVVETEMGTQTAAEFQYVVVKLREGTAGQRLYAIRKIDELMDKDRKLKADLIQVMGEIEVMELVNEKENLYRALVRKVINPIHVGSTLLAGEMPTVNSSFAEASAQLDARVVAGEHQVQRRLFAQYALVVLNRGTSQGASVGQTVRLFRQPLSRNELSKEKSNLRPVGSVKIVQASENFSTGLVVQASEEIRAGDSTGDVTILE